MAPPTSTSDGSPGIERRTIQGREALVGLASDEIHIQWQPTRPTYLGVHVGDRIKDAATDQSSVRIDEWEVVEITPDDVVGTHEHTGDRRTWSRATLERDLAFGTYATNLTCFERVSILPFGDWERYDSDSDHGTDPQHELAYHGRPYVMVAVYGDNGEKYGLRYAYADTENRSTLLLRAADPNVTRLPSPLRSALDETVWSALEADGYVIADRA